MERSRARSGNGAGSGGYITRLKHGAAFSPFALCSHALITYAIERIAQNANMATTTTITECNKMLSYRRETTLQGAL